MGVTVNIYYSGINGNAGTFVEKMEKGGTAEMICSEEENERYEYFFPYNAPETVLLIDSWKDQKSIYRHHSSDMMKTIMRLREKYDLHMRVERFVPDEFEVPNSDKKFIKK